jgi:DNA polymerase I-like protein with 3'-5' exonuclease and polymerase domains
MSDFTVLDIETTGNKPWTGDLVAVGVGKRAYRPEEGRRIATLALNAIGTTVVAHTNYDLRWLCLSGIPLGSIDYHDTKVMAWMDDSAQELALDDLAVKYLRVKPKKPIRMRKGRVMFDLGLWRGRPDLPHLVPIEDVPWPTMKAYNESDLKVEARLYEVLREKLQARGLWQQFLEEEAPFSKLLIEMETTGLPFDKAAAEKLLASTNLTIGQLRERLAATTGAIGFNPASHEQVKAFLYGELWSQQVKFEIPRLNGISPEEKAEKVAAIAPPGVVITKVGRDYAYGEQWLDGRGWKELKAKRPVTGEMVVTVSSKKLDVVYGDDPWVQDFVAFKREDKLRGYLEGWVEDEHDGLLHGRFDQSGTISGRLAGREPNLQQVSKESDVRGLFRGDLVVGDYAQLEARLATHFSQDPFLLQVFNDGLDLYGMLASEAWGGPPTKENEHRDLMKIVWLASQYGARGDTLAQTMAEGGVRGYTGAQADAYLADIQKTVPRMFAWREEVVAQARIDGQVVTIGGRPRALADLNSAAWQLRYSAERQAVNTLVQGSAADIVRRAMLAARAAVSPVVARICLQVHDEILWKRSKRFSAKTLATLRSVCEGGHGYVLDVPLKFEVSTAESWADKA